MCASTAGWCCRRRASTRAAATTRGALARRSELLGELPGGVEHPRQEVSEDQVLVLHHVEDLVFAPEDRIELVVETERADVGLLAAIHEEDLRLGARPHVRV